MRSVKPSNQAPKRELLPVSRATSPSTQSNTSERYIRRTPNKFALGPPTANSTAAEIPKAKESEVTRFGETRSFAALSLILLETGRTASVEKNPSFDRAARLNSKACLVISLPG